MLQERDEILETTIKDVVNKVKTRQIKATDLTTYFIERIKNIDSKINSVITIEKEKSLKRAEEIEFIVNNNILTSYCNFFSMRKLSKISNSYSRFCFSIN